MKRSIIAALAACALAASLSATTVKKVPATMALTPESLRAAAHDYYEWQKKEYPVGASEQGFHDYDAQLTDYSQAAIARRAAYVRNLLDRVRGTKVDGWSKDNQID